MYLKSKFHLVRNTMEINSEELKSLEEYKRVNNDGWICNQLEELVYKYEQIIEMNANKNLEDYDQGEIDELYYVTMELKELLYKK